MRYGHPEGVCVGPVHVAVGAGRTAEEEHAHGPDVPLRLAYGGLQELGLCEPRVGVTQLDVPLLLGGDGADDIDATHVCVLPEAARPLLDGLGGCFLAGDLAVGGLNEGLGRVPQID